MKASGDNLFTDGARGSARNMTIRQRKSGKQIISRRRRASELPPTDKQKAVSERFTQSIIYAKSVLTNKERLALYQAAVRPDQSAYGLAVRDAYKAPKVHSISSTEYTGQAGEAIVVRATDDFKVISLRVFIYGVNGELLEKGDGVAIDNSLDWSYTTTQINASLAGTKIVATAMDLPGNTGSLEVTL
jgi:hypothetical protein